METELLHELYTIIDSGIIRLLIAIFIAMSILTFLKWWGLKMFYSWRINSMNIIAEDRYIQIAGIKGTAVIDKDMLKIKNNDLIAWIPLKRVVEEEIIIVPVIKEREGE